jgi:hypothetical protein
VKAPRPLALARVALVVTTLLLAKPLSAQVRTLYNSEQVPRDLVIALLSYDAGMSTVPELLIGEMPSPLVPRIPLPPGARVLGSQVGYWTIVVIETTLSGDSLRAFFRQQLPQRGWMLAPPDSRFVSRGGFVPDVPRSPAGQVYCSDAQALTYQVIARPNGTSLVKVRVTDSEDEQTCNPKLEETMTAQFRRPTLLLPPGTDHEPWPLPRDQRSARHVPDGDRGGPFNAHTRAVDGALLPPIDRLRLDA